MPSSSGICQSSRARSGFSASIIATASGRTPPRRRARRRRRRAGAPPGTTAPAARRRRRRREARVVTAPRPAASARDTLGLERHAHPTVVPPPAAAVTLQRRRGPVLAGEPALDVGQADALRAAALHRVAGRAAAGVAHDQQDEAGSSGSMRAWTRTSPPSRVGAMPCLTAFSTSGCSMSGGTRKRVQRRGHVDGEPQAVLRIARARSRDRTRRSRARARAS